MGSAKPKRGLEYYRCRCDAQADAIDGLRIELDRMRERAEFAEQQKAVLDRFIPVYGTRLKSDEEFNNVLVEINRSLAVLRNEVLRLDESTNAMRESVNLPRLDAKTIHEDDC
jgi:hypothetical protein